MPTQDEVARHLDLNGARYIRELRDRQAIPDPATATLDEVRVAYIRHLRLQAAGRRGQGETIDLADERARLARAQADAQERENARAAGEILHVDDVVQHWSEMLVAVKSALRALPKAMVTRIPGFNRKMATEALRIIDEALDELSGNGVPKKRTRKGRRRVRAA